MVMAPWASSHHASAFYGNRSIKWRQKSNGITIKKKKKRMQERERKKEEKETIAMVRN